MTRGADPGAAPGGPRGGASLSGAPAGDALVLRSGALGDFVLTLPVLAALGKARPGARVLFVGRDTFGQLARMGGLADRAISQEAPEVLSLFSPGAEAGEGFARLAGPVSLAVSFLGSADAAANLLRAGAGEVLSCSARPPAGVGVHGADHLVSVLRGRLDVPSPAVPRLPVPDAARERARASLEERGLAPGRVLVMQPGSGGARKNWPAERFVEVARHARGDMGMAVALVLGPAELERGADALQGLAAVADAVLESPRLTDLAAALAEAAAYVGNDSGVTHLAAACGAPTVAVFGPSDPGVWAPRGERVRVLRDPSGDLARVEAAAVVEALRDVAGLRA